MLTADDPLTHNRPIKKVESTERIDEANKDGLHSERLHRRTRVEHEYLMLYNL